MLRLPVQFVILTIVVTAASSTPSSAETPTKQLRNHEYVQPASGSPLPLPDVSHLADKFRDKAKYDQLVAMLDVWEPALSDNSDAYRVNKGNRPQWDNQMQCPGVRSRTD